jgi:hypothetical protein
MKNLKFPILLTFIILSANSVFSQEYRPNFYANTIDELHWKGTSFMCSVSPLSSFFSLSPSGGYETICKDLPSYHLDYFSLPVSADKNYIAFWTIINKQLYLFNVTGYAPVDSNHIVDNNIYFDRIEKFLFMKFSKDNLSKSDRKRYENGVIPAMWFTDTLYIKRFPNKDEDGLSTEYNNTEFIRLVFEKGILTEEKKVTGMNE